MVFKWFILGIVGVVSGTFLYDILRKQPVGSTLGAWTTGVSKGLTELGRGVEEFGVGYQRGISAFISPQFEPRFAPEIEFVPRLGLEWVGPEVPERLKGGAIWELFGEALASEPLPGRAPPLGAPTGVVRVQVDGGAVRTISASGLASFRQHYQSRGHTVTVVG